jgi:hypothetical protein
MSKAKRIKVDPDEVAAATESGAGSSNGPFQHTRHGARLLKFRVTASFLPEALIFTVRRRNYDCFSFSPQQLIRSTPTQQSLQALQLNSCTVSGTVSTHCLPLPISLWLCISTHCLPLLVFNCPLHSAAIAQRAICCCLSVRTDHITAWRVLPASTLSHCSLFIRSSPVTARLHACGVCTAAALSAPRTCRRSTAVWAGAVGVTCLDLFVQHSHRSCEKSTCCPTPQQRWGAGEDFSPRGGLTRATVHERMNFVCKCTLTVCGYWLVVNAIVNCALDRLSAPSARIYTWTLHVHPLAMLAAAVSSQTCRSKLA